LKPVEKVAAEPLTTVSTVRALSNGRVLVNDINGRRLVSFDADLATFTVVADTTSATANAYASRIAGLVPWKGDSSLFVDPQTLSVLVIDPLGQVARVMSVPRADDAMALIGGPNGTPGVDAQGRLVYRGQPSMRSMMSAFQPRGEGASVTTPQVPDSMPILRLTLATRKLDTVTFIRTPKVNLSISRDDNGRVSVNTKINPMQMVDDWAVMPDGRVAVIRGREYKVEFYGDGSTPEATTKLAFAWRQMTDSLKQAFLDSTKAFMEKQREAQLARMKAGGNPMMAMPEGGGPGGGGPMVVMRFDGGGPPGGGGDGPRPNPNVQNVQLPPINFVEPSELPDYAPPFNAGSAKADFEGNLWIRTSNVVEGGSVYDVVNGKGELVDRVQMPPGRVIAGFGPGGAVYMGVRDGAVAKLEKAHRP
ncbi:MAG: hypothetical protein HY275_12835, partial [Gemmatimonadetes bacterium]|nr:hypothetical protein [Gemmatimonadota bacterium]